jgi:NADH-quinone oxidoreductase subunit J
MYFYLLLFFFILSATFMRGFPAATKGEFTLSAIEQSGGNIRVISEIMFSDYILPFQMVGLLLSICIVGAVVLAKKRVE